MAEINSAVWVAAMDEHLRLVLGEGEVSRAYGQLYHHWRLGPEKKHFAVELDLKKARVVGEHGRSFVLPEGGPVACANAIVLEYLRWSAEQ